MTYELGQDRQEEDRNLGIESLNDHAAEVVRERGVEIGDVKPILECERRLFL
jgi:hypothetical protein